MNDRRFPVRLKTLGNAYCSFPTLWDGLTVNGEKVYIRFRHGHLSVNVDGETVWEIQMDNQDGIMTDDEMRSLLIPNTLLLVEEMSPED